MSREPVEKIFFSKQEAAQALGVSTRTVEYLIAQGEKLEVTKIGRKVLISAASLQRLAKSRVIPINKPKPKKAALAPAG